MPAQPEFYDDKLESLVRKCIVFPADGSETRLVPMIARTVTDEDISSRLAFYRYVDMASTLGDGYRRTRVMAHRAWYDVLNVYLLFYNLSPNLPINLNLAHLIGVTPPHLKIRKRLFWRGDVVAMKVRQKSERIDRIVENLEADLSDLGFLEELFLEKYQKGVL